MRGAAFWAIAVTSVCGAVLAATAAASNVLAAERPGFATSLPLSGGFARTELADELVSFATGSGAPVLNVPQRRRAEVRRLSEEAFRREPLNSRAIVYLALTEPDPTRAGTLMHDAKRLSRREQLANLWLVSDAAQHGDLAGALVSLDDALRTSESGRPLLMRKLVETLPHPEVVPIVNTLLAARPPWASDFWATAYQVPAALPNVAQLRILAARRGDSGNPRYDISLLQALRREKQYAVAEELYDALVRDNRPSGERVRNSEFSHVPQFPLFDWQLVYHPAIAVDLRPQPGQLLVRAVSGAGGTVARQLVDLPAGAYRIAASFRNWTESSRGELSASLSCATAPGAAPLVSIALAPQQEPLAVQVPASPCRYFWLELNAEPRPGADRSEVALDAISLKSLTAGG